MSEPGDEGGEVDGEVGSGSGKEYAEHAASLRCWSQGEHERDSKTTMPRGRTQMGYRTEQTGDGR